MSWPGDSAPPTGKAPYGGRGPLVLGIIWTEASLVFILLALRTYVRFRVVKSSLWSLGFGWFAFILALVSNCFLTNAVANGVGQHIRVIAEAGFQFLSTAIKSMLISVALSYFALGFAKISVVAWLLGITGITTNKVTKGVLWGLALTNLVLNLIAGFLTLFECGPTLGDVIHPPPGGCKAAWAAEVTTYLCSSWGAFVDFALALYPIYVLWKLQMQLRLKLMLGGLMGLGLFAGICAILKTDRLKTAAYDRSTHADPTYQQFALTLFQWTEMYLVLICSSIPPIWPLFRKAVEKRMSPRPTGQAYGPTAAASSRKTPMSRSHESHGDEDLEAIDMEEDGVRSGGRKFDKFDTLKTNDSVAVYREVSVHESPRVPNAPADAWQRSNPLRGNSNEEWVDWRKRGPKEWV